MNRMMMRDLSSHTLQWYLVICNACFRTTHRWNTIHDKALPSAVIYALMKGERPKHSLSPKVVGYGLCDELWQALWGCWESPPINRLSLQLLHEILDNLASSGFPPSPAGPNHVQSSITVSITVMPIMTVLQKVFACSCNICSAMTLRSGVDVCANQYMRLHYRAAWDEFKTVWIGIWR